MSKMTGWFPAGVKPVREGVYIAEFDICTPDENQIWFAHWDGKNWGWLTLSANRAKQIRRNKCSHPIESVQWRGLASDPSKGKK